MRERRTRKNTYKLRKIGKFNYSITIPPVIAEYIGAIDPTTKELKNVEYYLNCINGNIVISNDELTDIKGSYINTNENGWRISLNMLLPHIYYDNNVFGYSTEHCCYLCITPKCPYIRYGTKIECLESLQQDSKIQPPQNYISSLSNYVASL